MDLVRGLTLLTLACALTRAQEAASRTEFPLHRISSGGLVRLDRNGNLVRSPARLPHKLDVEPVIAAGLDPRVGPAVRLGDDPPALPATMRAQAEPHLARHPLNPDILLATFQEGRYFNGGAVSCGYGVSTNGGLSWSRVLVPKLTTNTGGPYLRATDPVAGIDLQGNLFLNNLASLDAGFTTSALVISRSTNGGVTFEPPIEIARSPDTSVFLDKNWMTINTFSNTPTAGRIVSTFTRFEDTGGHPIAISYSDDQGRTWSQWKYATRSGQFFAQGSQPLFLPSGTLAIVYWNFGWNQQPFETIEIVVSTNGGASFNYSNRVTAVSTYDTPRIRDGIFLPSAAGNRTNDSIYVAYQALHNGSPRILFTMSPDAGRTWSTPKPVSDNPPSSPVFNAAIAVSDDGQKIGVLFYDQRVNPANANSVDVFLAQSTDGGTTWLPNVRLTAVSSDASRAPQTGDGYMLGDYQGLVAAGDQAFAGIHIDTRTGSPDPFSTRTGIADGFAGWRDARFSLAELQAGLAAPHADAEGDGADNALEYGLAQNPRASDGTALRASVRGNGDNRSLVIEYERLAGASDVNWLWRASRDLASWTPTVPSSESVAAGSTPGVEKVTAFFPIMQEAGWFFRPEVALTSGQN